MLYPTTSSSLHGETKSEGKIHLSLLMLNLIPSKPTLVLHLQSLCVHSSLPFICQLCQWLPAWSMNLGPSKSLNLDGKKKCVLIFTNSKGNLAFSLIMTANHNYVSNICDFIINRNHIYFHLFLNFFRDEGLAL